MTTKTTKEGWKVIDGDVHHAVWIEESGRLDHDQFLIPIACDNIPESGVVLDIGAMYGDHTIAYAKKVGKDGTVIAIEPSLTAFECLLENSKRFESDVLCIRAAVCEEHGGRAMHSEHEGNVGMSVVNEEEEKGVEIRTISIDGLVKDSSIQHLHFVKIDAEGWEYKILKGAKGTLTTLKPILLIEINKHTLNEQEDSDKDIYDLLLSLNYAWRIVQSNCNGASDQFDIMAWPNKIIDTSKNGILIS